MLDYVVAAEAAPLAKAAVVAEAAVLAEAPVLTRPFVEAWATPADREHAAGRRAAGARARSVAGRALLRWLLSASLGVDAAAWRIVPDGRGKPHLLGPSGETGPAVSVSHGGGLVACALARHGSLGIDVEAHRPRRRLRDLAEAAFGPRERAEVEAGGARAFYRIWALREAMGKAAGEGLALVTDRRDRVIGGPEWGAWTASVDGARWRLAHLEAHAGYSLAIALLPPDGDREQVWSLSSLRDLGGALPRSGAGR